MELKHEELQTLLKQMGWTSVKFAHKLELSYPHVYRIINDHRKPGIKFVSKFLQLCDQHGLDYHQYLSYSD